MGVEIGRSKVRLVMLDPSGREVVDVSERPIARAGGPRNPMDSEAATRAALVAALDRVGITDPSGHVAAATIGFPNCGVGSGPALRGWLESLSMELDERFVLVGDTGVSYAPARCVELVHRVFEDSGLMLDRVELAPVAAARILGRVANGAISLGSGIAWTARVLDDQVLEAFEAADAPFDHELLVAGPGTGPTSPAYLDGVIVDESLCRNRGVTPAALAPATGVALGVLSASPTNLLAGHTLHGAAPVTTASGRWATPSAATSFSRESAGHHDHASLRAPAEPDWSRPGPVANTHQLQRIPNQGPIHTGPDPRGSFDRPTHTGHDSFDRPADTGGNDFRNIEDFAFDESQQQRTLDGMDVALGALAVLAVVLVLLLVIA